MHSRTSAFMFILALVASTHTLPLEDMLARNDIGNAYTGVGGQASGGSVNSTPNGSETDLFAPVALLERKDNAGNGGDAKSGGASALPGILHSSSAIGGNPTGNSYSGAGGQAAGGSISNEEPALVKLFSGNAGNGGKAPSGNSWA